MRKPWQPGRTASDSANRDDVEKAFRLFLNRVPTEEDWAFWGPAVDEGNLAVEALTDSFLLSDETERRCRAASERVPMLVALDDFSIYVHRHDPAIGSVIVREGAYEDHVAAEIRRVLRAGDTFVDVGANVGYFTMLGASLVGPEGRVIAIEPRAANAALIERSLAANGFDNVTVHRTAVGAEAATGVLRVPRGTTNGMIAAIPDPVLPADAEPETVGITTLDDLLSGVSAVKLVKMDIEGFEPQAWAGMQETISRHRPVVLMEISPIALRVASRQTPDDLLERVAASGYEPRVLRRTDVLEAEPKTRSEIVSALRILGEQGMTHLDLVAVPTRVD